LAPSKHRKSNGSWNTAYTIIGLIVVLVGGWFLGAALGWWGAAPGGVAPTNYSFTVVDYATGNATDETEDIQIALYEADVTGLDATEIADLDYADFTATENVTSGEDYAPDPNFVYWALMTGDGFQTEWFQPVLGENIIYAMNLTEDVSMLAHTIDGPLSATCLHSAYHNWEIDVQTLDLTEGATAEATSLEGFKSVYDFENDDSHMLTIRVSFDNAAEASFATLIGCEFTEVCSGNYTYFEIDTTLLDSDSFTLKLSSELEGTGAYAPTTFNLEAIAVGYNNAGDFTAWDTQA